MTCQCEQQTVTGDCNSARLWYCANCDSALNSLPFFNLSDDDFNSIINQRFNLKNNLLTAIQSALHLNIANESLEDNNFDPFNNGLLEKIRDNCQYYA